MTQRQNRTTALMVFLLLVVLALAAARVSQGVIVYRKLSTQLPADLAVLDPDGHTPRGSAVHIGNGLVLTAAHVVGEDGILWVKDEGGQQQRAEVLWANKSYDLALLVVRHPEHWRSAELDCAAGGMGVGDIVSAVGNPLDEEFLTMWGRVSGGTAMRGPWRQAFVVDMMVAPGMSGGATYDEHHRLTGITVGMGAIPQMGGVILNPFAFGYIVPTSAACLLMGQIGQTGHTGES